VSRKRGGARLGGGLRHEGRPDLVHPPLELRQGAVVLDDDVRAGALELRRHLRRDHAHGFRLGEVTIVHEPLEPTRTIGVHQNHAIEEMRQVLLEEERNVGDDYAIAAGPRGVQEMAAEPLDFRVHHRIELFQLARMFEHAAAERRAVEPAVGAEDRVPPALNDLIICRSSCLDGAAREDVGVDDRRPVLGQELSDCRFAASDISGEADEKHGQAYERGRGASTNKRGGSVAEDTDELEAITRKQLELLGENPDREGLLRTPHRVAESLRWLTRGYGMNVKDVVGQGVFDSEGTSNMVMVREIELYSMCEHHMLPFFGKAHVAYIPNGKIVGLSKIPRVVEMFARRLQVQERLTEQIASALEQVLEPRGVGVVIEAYHLCMMMRGVEKQNSRTITSALRGSFREDARTREEFLTLAYAKV